MNVLIINNTLSSAEPPTARHQQTTATGKTIFVLETQQQQQSPLHLAQVNSESSDTIRQKPRGQHQDRHTTALTTTTTTTQTPQPLCSQYPSKGTMLIHQHGRISVVVKAPTDPAVPSPLVGLPSPDHNPAVGSDDTQSDISSLQCGSIVWNFNYDPAKDPEGRPFVPPLEITVGRKRRPSPALLSDDTQSDISPLQCGSIVWNLHYDPAKDPEGRPFVPPLEITVRTKRRPSSPSVDGTPEWLVLDHEKKPTGKVDVTVTEPIRATAPSALPQRRRRSLTPDKREHAFAVMRGIKSAPTSPAENREQVWHPHATPVTHSPSSTSPPGRFLKPANGVVIHKPVLMVEGNMTPVYSDLPLPVAIDRPLPSFAQKVVPVSSFTDTVPTMRSEVSSSEDLPRDGKVTAVRTTTKLTMKHIADKEDGTNKIQKTSTPACGSPNQRRKGMVRREFQRRVLSMFNTFNSNNKEGSSRTCLTISSKADGSSSNNLRQAIGAWT